MYADPLVNQLELTKQRGYLPSIRGSMYLSRRSPSENQMEDRASWTRTSRSRLLYHITGRMVEEGTRKYISKGGRPKQWHAATLV